MHDPFVSVVVPVYNTEEFVGRTIESILGQSFRDFEVLLVDDGSTDGSGEICSVYAEKDNRIQCLFIEHNGVSKARNCGVTASRGKIILFCDSDDVWDENLLQLVTDAFQDDECGMVRFNLKSENEEIISTEDLTDKTYSQKELLEKYFSDNTMYTCMSSCCLGGYRKAIIEKYGICFDETLAMGEDGIFVMQYLLCVRKIVVLGNKLYHYYPVFENRMNATARNLKELYNEYELCEILFCMFYKSYNAILDDEEKKRIYGAFVNRLIGRLVRFAAYSPYSELRKNVDVLRLFINKEDVQAAIGYYHPIKKINSKLIPFCIKQRWAFILWLALYNKKEKYYKMYGKKMYGVSIYKKDPMVCFQKESL